MVVNLRSLVRPLEQGWQDVLDAVLRPHMPSAGKGRARPTEDVAWLGPKLAELSRAYNAGTAAGAASRLPLEARLAFSFPRDVPKGAAAVRELVAAGVLRVGEKPLRILDLGAGVGAMTWGVVRALHAAGQRGRIEATLVDEDAVALAAGEALAREAKGTIDGIDLVITTRKERLSSELRLEPAELVVVGQVLSELDLAREPAERITRHTALLAGLLRNLVADDGSLVVVEPALRDRTRHLHAVRDELLACKAGHVFAPCLHAARCPMLLEEDAWCHEDLAIDLPAWVVPLARAAGLRFQGLTFSYLVLRRDEATVAGPLRDGRAHLRVVSELLRSKGKIELFGCFVDGERRRIRRLDRDEASQSGVPFSDLAKGDIVTVDGKTSAPIDERGRIIPVVTIDVWPSAN